MFIHNIAKFDTYSDVKAISSSQENIKIFNEGLKNLSVWDIQNIAKKWDIAETKENNIKYFISFALIIFVVIGIIMFINYRLKKLVSQKTSELEKLNKELEQKVQQRTKELEQKTKEAQKNAKTKARFLANMSHEIRTPLNSIIGFVSLLQEEDLNPSAKRYVDIIDKSSRSLLGIINDILDFSKIEEGKLTIEKIAFNLDEEIDNIAQMFYAKADEKHITFKILKENTDLMVITDPIRFKQILLNLLSNAFKFTDDGKTITLSVKYENKQIFVSVKDEGIGIAKDKLDHIFKDFTQADDSTTRKYGGTGLGLSISSSLVELLGGKLEVKSEEKKGSEFYFSIPAESVKSNNQKKKNIKQSKEFNYYVLLAEDNKANQMFMEVVLNKLGLKFDVANDGLEAVDMYKENYDKYDLILMDENMPNMTGRVATIEIRNFEKENNLKPIFIVALTANALTGDKDKFLKAGMNEYLSKPLEIAKLIEILEKLDK
jgi:signal transduction histidine kinase/ActR/RegA family two-component response regulator